MKRLKLLIIAFCAALSVPLAYFVWQSYRSLEREEFSQLRYFAETLFDEMERELAEIVVREERRAIDEYNFRYVSAKNPPDVQTRIPLLQKQRSPLSKPPAEEFILGYLQNNPDGSFQTPLNPPLQRPDPAVRPIIDQLREINRFINKNRSRPAKSFHIPISKPVSRAPAKKTAEQRQRLSFADRYLKVSRDKRRRIHLGQEKKSVVSITAEQVFNLAQENRGDTGKKEAAEAPSDTEAETNAPAPRRRAEQESVHVEARVQIFREGVVEEAETTKPAPLFSLDTKTFQVEVDPIQTIFIDSERFFLFRRIVVDNRIYRQGAVIRLDEFLGHLAAKHFENQPMARFTQLELRAYSGDRIVARTETGAPVKHPDFRLKRGFPRPFSFLEATLTCQNIPRSAGRNTLNVMVVLIAVVISAGFFALYQSARTIVEMSERRSTFVSSVTHELKTPLTNIRMYIEMLEQGIARTPERERDYFRILGSESARLSRLINNVLEFAKLEKKQRPIEPVKGDFTDVLREVETVMGEKLRQENFTLKIDAQTGPGFYYDREMMIQVLINLLENSMKFGKNSPEKQIGISVSQDNGKAVIQVSDTGPGIPRRALNKIFDDFYRVDNEATRTTRGTGIGLALVRKLIHAAGGTITAANNEGPGCVITITLPGRNIQGKTA